MAELAQRLIKTWDRLRSEQSNFRSLWSDIDDYISPHRDPAQTREFPGQQRTEKMFDGTAPWALSVSAAAIHGTLVPSWVKWFEFELDAPGFRANRTARLWFESVTTSMFKAINNSNFNSEAAETFSDLLAYNTGTLWTSERTQGGAGFRGLRFQAFQPKDVVVMEDEDGLVDTLYRSQLVDAQTLLRMFGDRVSSGVKRRIDRNEVDSRVEILHAVFPRLERRRGIQGLSLSRQMPFASIWLERDTKHILVEGGLEELSYAVPRWSKTSSEVYGRGPGLIAIPDIKTLNRAVELRLKAWAKAVDPPLLVNDRGVIGPIRMVPGGLNSVRRDGAIQPFINNARFDVSNFSEADLQQKIMRAFFIDQIQLPPIAGTPISATEVATRFETMQRILGPTFGRIEHEFLDVTLRRIFFLMLRREALPEAPPDLMDILQNEPERLRIRFDGPLVRARQASEVEAIQRAYAVAGPIAPAFPEVMDFFDHQEAGRLILDALRVPQAMMRSIDEVQALAAGRQQVAAEEVSAEEAALTTRGLRDVTPFLRELSAGALS